jgi:hypothetical protein
MHDIETRIGAWRAELWRAVRDDEVVQELEEHLRESYAAELALGVAEPAAFERAVARLGDPRSLAREIARSRSIWFGGVASPGMKLMAHVGASLGSVGVLVFLPVCFRLIRAAVHSAPFPGYPPGPGFGAVLVTSWVLACGLAVRSCSRYLAAPNPVDAHGVVGFNLLCAWMLGGWVIGPSALAYPTKLALILTTFGILVLLWRTWARRLGEPRPHA